MMKKLSPYFLAIILSLLSFQNGKCQEQTSDLKKQVQTLQQTLDDMDHRFDILQKQTDDVLWYEKVGDVGYIDKVIICGPPPAKVSNPTAMGATNPLKFQVYIFIPKHLDPAKKYPLIVLPHGGVHGDFGTYHTHIIREFLAQGYIVAAPDYRGSTGYGKSFWEKIDYGGLEIDDINATRDYMVNNYEMIDSGRVGLVGWSHGGLIALMDVFAHPEDYKVCFAGVPVSDLIARMGYYGEEYRNLFSAKYHIGKTAQEDVEEYKRRSPAWNAAKLKTPLLIHTNTIDDDVNVLEVEHLIQALKAENKKFEYEIFKGIEGGHSFDRIDTQAGKEIRLKIYKFLAGYLNPPVRFNKVSDMNKAAYFH